MLEVPRRNRRVQVAVVNGTRTSELRRAVLRPAWPVGALMHGDDDPAAVHLAVLDAPVLDAPVLDAPVLGAPVLDAPVLGACVLTAKPYPNRPSAEGAWQLRGMATEPSWRGMGIGAALLEEAERQARALGATLLWCQARLTAVGFYARHRFIVDGPEFQHAETGLGHRYMVREPLGRAASSEQ